MERGNRTVNRKKLANSTNIRLLTLPREKPGRIQKSPKEILTEFISSEFSRAFPPPCN
jgi:hypothetical protein